jgi:hypothetical protein
MPEASQADKNMYGADVRLHPITNMPLEYGIGHAPDDVQAQNHCIIIEREQGKKVADAYRAKLAEAAKNPEGPLLTAAKLAAERAQAVADTAHANFEAKAAIATSAKAKVAELSKTAPAKSAAYDPMPRAILATEQDS